jgi:hypothetical protein
MGCDCVTSNLVPRLAWGVGHRNKAERRVRCCMFQWVKSGGELSFLHCLVNISLKSFFNFCFKYLTTKLETKQLDMMNVIPQLGL